MSATAASPLQYYRTRQRTVRVVHPMESPQRGLPSSHHPRAQGQHRAVQTPTATDLTQQQLLHGGTTGIHDNSMELVRRERDEYHRVILSMQSYIDELHGQLPIAPTPNALRGAKEPLSSQLRISVEPRRAHHHDAHHRSVASSSAALPPRPQVSLQPPTAAPPRTALRSRHHHAAGAPPSPLPPPQQRPNRLDGSGSSPERTARSSSAQYWMRRHNDLQVKCETLSRRLASCLCDQQRVLLDATAEWQQQRAAEVEALHRTLDTMDEALRAHSGTASGSFPTMGHSDVSSSVVERCRRVADVLHRHLADKPRDQSSIPADGGAELPRRDQGAPSSSSYARGMPLVLQELSATTLSLGRLSSVRQALSDAARILFLSDFQSWSSPTPAGAPDEKFERNSRSSPPLLRAQVPHPDPSDYVPVQDFDEHDDDKDSGLVSNEGSRNDNTVTVVARRGGAAVDGSRSPFEELRRRIETDGVGSVDQAKVNQHPGSNHSSPQAARSSLSSTASTTFEVHHHHVRRTSVERRAVGAASPSTARSPRTSSSPSPPQTRPASRSASAQPSSGGSRRPEAAQIRCALDIIREAHHTVDDLIASLEENRCLLESRLSSDLLPTTAVQSAPDATIDYNTLQAETAKGATGGNGVPSRPVSTLLPPERVFSHAATANPSRGEDREWRSLTPPVPPVHHYPLAPVEGYPRRNSFELLQTRFHAPPMESDDTTDHDMAAPLIIEEVDTEFDPTVETNFVATSETDEEYSDLGATWERNRRPSSPPILTSPPCGGPAPIPAGGRRAFVVSPSADEDDDREVTELAPRFSTTTVRGTETPLSVTWGNGTSANSSVFSERRRVMLSPVN